MLDPSNLDQNILQVTHSVTQIKNQLEQLYNMGQNTKSMTAEWDQALPLLNQLGSLMNQGQSLAYSMDNIDAVFRNKFPGYTPYKDWHSEYGTWTNTTLDTLRLALRAVNMQSGSFLNEQMRLQSLATLSESVIGRKQAIQMGNAIAHEQAQQLVKLRQLMMLQINTQTAYQAAQVNEQAQRDAYTREWLLRGEGRVPAYVSNGRTRIPGVSR